MKKLLLITTTVFSFLTISVKMNAQNVICNTLPNMPSVSQSTPATSNDTSLFYLSSIEAGANSTSSIYYYSFAQSKWNLLTTVPEAIWNCSLEAVDSCLYIFGGGDWSNRVYSYNLLTGIWNKKEDMSIGRQHILYSSVVVDSFIYVIGGLEKGSYTEENGDFEKTKPSNLNQRYNFKNNSWEDLAPIPTPRQNPAVVVVDSLIYVIGGEGDSKSIWTSLKIVEVYNTKNNSWSTATSLPFARSVAGAELIDNEIWLICGWKDGYNNLIDDRIFIYNLDSANWKISSQKIPKPIVFAGITSYKNKIYLINGCNASFVNYNSVYELSKKYIIDYLGQTPPGDTAVLFAPGIISIPDRFESNLVFYPDSNEIYFDTWVNTDTVYKILYTKKVNNKWTDQVALPFKENINAGNPFLSADGKKLYYEKNNDIWMVERTTGGWSDPKLLPSPVNTNSTEYYYSESDDGVGYITSDRPGGKGILDIWQIRSFPNDSFQAENLGNIINSSSQEYMSCIAHDGSFLIYNTFRYSNYSLQDLWIAFKKENNEWTIPLGMERSGAKINVPNYAQLCPTLSPDGKYLFFSRENSTNDQRDVYWVSTHIIDTLKKIAFAPKKTRQIPNMNITTDSTINYVIPENTFTCEYGMASLKYTATLKNGSDLPTWLHFDHETRTLSGTPTQAGTDTLQITATNADTMSASCTFKIKVTLNVSINPLDGQKVGIFPNPTTGLVNISFGNTIKKAVVEIYNIDGQQIFSQTYLNSAFATADLTGNSNGLYLVKLTADSEIYTQKINLK